MSNRDPNTYKLLTPGPLTTTLTVREAMLVDRCTWDDDYKSMTQDIRARLLKIAHAGDDYTAVLMQGSGTFGVESVLSSLPGANDHVLVLVNGAYSKRMCEILARHKVAHTALEFDWAETPDAAAVEAHLAAHPEVTMVSMVHNETTTGLLNDIASVARVVKAAGRTMIVDAMSSFGAVDIDVPGLDLDVVVSSANKCIQGVPGFSFVIMKKSVLEASKGNARTLSLDLYDQWATLEKDGGKWRYTSPTHVVAAFHQALLELDAEGGRCRPREALRRNEPSSSRRDGKARLHGLRDARTPGADHHDLLLSVGRLFVRRHVRGAQKRRLRDLPREAHRTPELPSRQHRRNSRRGRRRDSRALLEVHGLAPRLISAATHNPTTHQGITHVSH